MIITSDLHLTDRKRDEYRWRIFNQLADALDNAPEGHDRTVLILGDITDKKDRHSAELVNRVCVEIELLADHCDELIVLKGNHDYVDADTPFFQFLDGFSGVRFITNPTVLVANGLDILFLPHERDPRSEWSEYIGLRKPLVDIVMAHQTFQGATGSNGMQLSGPGPNFLSELLGRSVPIISGDIHKPQDLGDVTYCGTPYPVAFGDDHEPTILQLDAGDTKPRRIPVDTIRKTRVDLFRAEEFDDHDWSEGDQARVVLHLKRSDYGLAQDIQKDVRGQAAALGVDLYGFKLVERVVRKRKKLKADVKVSETKQETLTRFCTMEGVDRTLAERGANLIK